MNSSIIVDVDQPNKINPLWKFTHRNLDLPTVYLSYMHKRAHTIINRKRIWIFTK